MKVGDVLWVRDNRDSRRGWESHLITGETKQSWMVGGRKVLKSTMIENQGKWGSQRWHTPEGKEDQRWVDARFSIGQRISAFSDDPALLKKVAEIIGYILPEPKG